MGHTAAVEPTILSPGIRTFKPRRSRITPRQARALASPGWHLLTSDTLSNAWESNRPVVLDIGFGSASPVVELARHFPEQTILAIDVHTPGIGDLVDRCSTEGIDNVFIIEQDVLALIPRLPHSVAGVRSFFPDPWPKARHHKRRLAQPAVIDAMAEVVQPGGFWHLATDWPEYAESIIEAFSSNDHWSGGSIDRPEWRPLTHFEKRGIREGRPIVDVWFTRN